MRSGNCDNWLSTDKQKTKVKKLMSISIKNIENTHYLLHDGPDLINQHLMSEKPWESSTQKLCQLLIGHIDSPVIIDVGANIGAFASPIGRWLKDKNGQLIAYEPQKMAYFQLCGNLFINDLTNCQAIHKAVGNYDGTIDVPELNHRTCNNIGGLSLDADIQTMQSGSNFAHLPSNRIDIVKLDSEELPKMDLIKIDVEGLEFEVISGAIESIKKHKPYLFFEVWGDYMTGYIEKKQALLDLVKSLGYQILFIGELCIAQHHSKIKLTLQKKDEQYHFSMNTDK